MWTCRRSFSNCAPLLFAALFFAASFSVVIIVHPTTFRTTPLYHLTASPNPHHPRTWLRNSRASGEMFPPAEAPADAIIASSAGGTANAALPTTAHQPTLKAFPRRRVLSRRTEWH